MTFFDRLERRIGWVSFPGFLRFYALFHVLVFVLRFIRPDIGLLLEFDRAKIMSGEIWRVATFFFAGSSVGRPSLVSIVFLACAVNFIFMVSDGLEGAWGVFKTSLFYYTGILLLLVANFAYPMNVPLSGFALYASAFFAFATLFPKVEILLFMILPVEVRILGIIQAATIALMVVGQPILFPFALLAFANYIIWSGIPALRGTARIIESGKRKKAFNIGKIPDAEAFHTCAACKRTDASHPEIEFRVGGDGREYCGDHVPE
ncbi:MAG: hypothetical protein ABI162_00180 [Luteolibacter sp.]